MDAFLTSLLRNAPFLVVLLPVVGAVLVAGSARLGVQAARRTGQANALITALLAVGMAGWYLAEFPQGQRLASRQWAWLQAAEVGDRSEIVGDKVLGPDVRLGFAVDGVNLWFAVAVCLGMFVVLRAGPEDERGGPAFYVLLLLWEACLLGAFLAADVAVFVVCAEGALVPAFLMVCGWGGYERRASAVRWLIVQGVAGAAITAGLMLLVLGQPSSGEAVSFSIETLAATPVTGEWAFPVLLFGFLLRAAILPLHTWFVPIALEMPPATNLLLTIGGLNVGLYGLLRFVGPIFPEAVGASAGTLVGLCVLGTVFASLLVLAQGNLLKFTASVTLANMAACGAGLFATDPLGGVAAVVHAVHHAAAVGLLLYIVIRLNERFGTADVEAYGGLVTRCPRLALLLGLAVFAIVGCPLTSGFVSRLLLLEAIHQQDGMLAFWLGVATLLLAWAGLWTLQRLLLGRPRVPIVLGREEAAERPVTDLDWGETIAPLPLVGVILWLGLWPSTFIEITAASMGVGVSPATTVTSGEDALHSPPSGGEDH